jgi:hypothetical protein
VPLLILSLASNAVMMVHLTVNPEIKKDFCQIIKFFFFSAGCLQGMSPACLCTLTADIVLLFAFLFILCDRVKNCTDLERWNINGEKGQGCRE